MLSFSPTSLYFFPGRLFNDPASQDDNLHWRQRVHYRIWAQTHRRGYSKESSRRPETFQGNIFRNAISSVIIRKVKVYSDSIRSIISRDRWCFPAKYLYLLQWTILLWQFTTSAQHCSDVVLHVMNFSEFMIALVCSHLPFMLTLPSPVLILEVCTSVQYIPVLRPHSF